MKTIKDAVIEAAKYALPDDAPMIGDWNTVLWVIEALYDAGMLVLPPKKSDTED